MAEKIIVRQDSRFETDILVYDPEAGKFQHAEHLHSVTPYGMLLVSLGTCTGVVLHAYAQKHGLGLRDTELRLQFKRTFKEDCENCEGKRKIRRQYRS